MIEIEKRITYDVIISTCEDSAIVSIRSLGSLTTYKDLQFTDKDITSCHRKILENANYGELIIDLNCEDTYIITAERDYVNELFYKLEEL